MDPPEIQLAERRAKNIQNAEFFSLVSVFIIFIRNIWNNLSGV